MSTATVRLSSEIIDAAKAAAVRNLRSLPKQIEYWAELGRIMERDESRPNEETLAAVREAGAGIGLKKVSLEYLRKLHAGEI
ncbi:MAG: ParD-like family protein [Rickettsiales bacterium]|nr:ParD-like family protein [Rickettsiales bacterium]